MQEWLLKILGMKTPNISSSVEEEARYVIAKDSKPLLQKFFRAIPYGISISFYAILVPFLATKYTDFSIVWIGLSVVLIAIVLHLIKSDYQLRARKWWAEKSLALFDESKRIEAKYLILEDNFQKGERQINSLTAAISTLSNMLKSNIQEKYNSEIIDDKYLQLNMNTRINSLRDELKNLCKYVCEIMAGSNHGEYRCGILIEDPQDKSTLIPVVVYNPDDEDYISQRTFSKSDDFSGRLIKLFQKNKNRKDWKSFAFHIIDNIDEQSKESHKTFPSINLQADQEKYISSIIGNIIYCKNQNRQPEVLGVMNIDSNLKNHFSEEKYKILQPYLFPAFRLLAERIIILKKFPNLIYPIWKNELTSI